MKNLDNELGALLALPPSPTLWTRIVHTAHSIHCDAPEVLERLRSSIEPVLASWPVGLRWVPSEWVQKADKSWRWEHPLLWMCDTLAIEGLFTTFPKEPAIDLHEMMAAPALAHIAVIDVVGMDFRAEQLRVILDAKSASFTQLLGLEVDRAELDLILGHERSLRGLGFVGRRELDGLVWGPSDLSEWDGITALERLELRDIPEFGVHLGTLFERLESVRHLSLVRTMPSDDDFSFAQVDRSENEFETQAAIGSIPGLEQRIEHLELHENGLPSLRPVGSGKTFERLHTLDIHSNPLGRHALDNLDVEHFPNLRILRARRCELDAHSVKGLSVSGMLSQLTELDLRDNDMSGDAAQIIANSAELGLTCLRLSAGIPDEGLRALALTNALPKLLSCDLLCWRDKPGAEANALVSMSPMLRPHILTNQHRAVDDYPERRNAGASKPGKKGLAPICKTLGVKGYSKLKVDALIGEVQASLDDEGLGRLRAEA